MLPSIVISDTSCLILFDKINHLHLLQQLFSKVYTTPEVEAEFGKILPSWIEIKAPGNSYAEILRKISDKGEASAISLALEFCTIENTFIILDDLKARKFALTQQLNIIGSMGIIVKAKQESLIPLVKPIFELIKATNFRIHEDLENKLLKVAGEL